MLALAIALQLVGALPSPTPPPPDDGAWKIVKIVDGVRLLRAPAAGRAPWGMGEGEIAAPIDAVIAHLCDFESARRFIPRVAEVRVLERRGDEALVYFRFDLPWPISDRDWTLRYRWARA